jgi:hypothetical protein
MKILILTKLLSDEKVRKIDKGVACSKNGRKKKLLSILVRKTEEKRDIKDRNIDGWENKWVLNTNRHWTDLAVGRDTW